jgi:hypothetical protein
VPLVHQHITRVTLRLEDMKLERNGTRSSANLHHCVYCWHRLTVALAQLLRQVSSSVGIIAACVAIMAILPIVVKYYGAHANNHLTLVSR